MGDIHNKSHVYYYPTARYSHNVPRIKQTVAARKLPAGPKDSNIQELKIAEKHFLVYVVCLSKYPVYQVANNEPI